MTNLNDTVKSILDDLVEKNYTLTDVIKDLNQGGCQSGFIGELIYYSDTSKFYDDHEEEIETLLDDMGCSRDDVGGDHFNIESYKNNAAWISFETTAQQYA